MKVNKFLSKTIFLAVPAACMFFSPSDVFAQVKIGSNPTTISTNNNLEVESDNGPKVVILKTNGRVGVGTDAPGARLHVQGNQILGTAQSVAESTGTSQMVRDNVTGEIKVLKTTTTNSFPISSVTFEISNVNKDWISNFDTKINAADYTLMIIGLVFNGSTLKNDNGDKTGYNPLNFQAFQAGGTWRLMADYDGGSPADGVNGKWIIRCLAINNSMIQQLPNQTANLGGTNTGALTNAPGGL